MPLHSSSSNSSRSRTDPTYSPARRVHVRARVLDQRHLPRREDRRDLPSRWPHPHRLGRAPAPSGHVLKQRPELGRGAMDSLRQRDRRRHAVQRLIAVERKHRLQANRDRALRQLRCTRRERDNRPVIAGAEPVHEAGELAQADIAPTDFRSLQPPPPQRERPRIRLHRVRRTRHPQVFEVLLGRADREAVATNDRPGSSARSAAALVEHEPLPSAGGRCYVGARTTWRRRPTSGWTTYAALKPTVGSAGALKPPIAAPASPYGLGPRDDGRCALSNPSKNTRG